MGQRLTAGDTVRITQPRRDHSVRYFARVTWTEEREAGTYFGYVPVDPPPDAWGLRAHEAGSFGANWLRNEPRPFSPEVLVVGRAP
jgi:hypothetical protein